MSAGVLRLDTPRTRALTALARLRLSGATLKPPPAEVAIFMLNMSIGDLGMVETADISDAATSEARRLYKRVLRRCTRAMGRGATLADLCDFDHRPDAKVYDLAAERAARRSA